MIHLEALTKEALLLFPKLNLFPNFYLAGGTAMALQLGHRISVDFDMFTLEPIPANFLATVEHVFSQKLQVLVNNNQELTVIVNPTRHASQGVAGGNVKITFLTYPFPVVTPTINLSGIASLSLLELGTIKAYTIGRRGSFKDYVDLYSIVCGGHSSLETILQLAEKKYGDQFNSRLFLEQLVYLEDVTDIAITFLAKPITKSDIEACFTKLIQELKFD